MLIRALSFCGAHGRFVLPLGLVAGIVFPFAAAPMRVAIPWCIGALLFLAVLRLFPNSEKVVSSVSVRQWWNTGKLVVATQIALPLLVFSAGSLIGVPDIGLLAMTLVAAAPPISGSPNLVLLLKGDGVFGMRWLMLGTALLPLSCLPVLWLLFPVQSIAIMLWPSIVLLGLIATAVALAFVVLHFTHRLNRELPAQAIDGASAILLASVVIGLMSAVHDPGTTWADIVWMLLLAIGINGGLQCLGAVAGMAMALNKARTTALGVVMGNRNVALYLTALPVFQLEPLLLFIACYQVPMYLTPLFGDVFYSRLRADP